MPTAEVNARLAEIYRTLTRMQELADKAMYHPYLDNVIKGVFLIGTVQIVVNYNANI